MKNKLSRAVIVCSLGISVLLPSCVGPYAGPNQRVGSVIGGALGAGAITTLLSMRVSPLLVCVLASTLMIALLAVSVRWWRRDRAPNDAPMFAVPNQN